jgi:hypothetical protein
MNLKRLRGRKAGEPFAMFPANWRERRCDQLLNGCREGKETLYEPIPDWRAVIKERWYGQ